MRSVLFQEQQQSCIIYRIKRIAIGDVVSLTFGGPIFIAVASIFFLSEELELRWSAVFLGAMECY